MSPAVIGLGVLSLLLLVFAVMGLRSTTRGTPVHQVLGPGGADDAPAVRDPHFRRSVELHTQTPMARGHAVDVTINGDQTFGRLWEDLRAATRSITIQMYYSQPGRVADTMRDVLVERARAGVRVFFLADAFGSQKLSRHFYDPLKDAGVRVATFRPIRWNNLDRAYHRAHIRVVVIDGRVGFTGGWGIDDKWLGDGRHHEQWRDTNVRFTGPAVLQHQAAFAAGWAEATGELLTGEPLFPDDAPNGDEPNDDAPSGVLAGLLHHTASVGSSVGERLMALSIAGARERLYISNSYFVPDRAFRALLTAAARRGVDVRILTVSAETDTKATRYAARAFYEELLSAGVRVYEYQPAMMHAKTLVADGLWCVAGSMNFDNRSLAFNDESNLLAFDADLGARLERVFLDDLGYAEEMQLQTFRHRPATEKAIEKLVSQFASLL